MNKIDNHIEILKSYKITEEEIATEGLMEILSGTNTTSKIYNKNNKNQEHAGSYGEGVLKAYTGILNDIKNSKYDTFYISTDDIVTITKYKKDTSSKFKAAIQNISPKLSKYFYLKDKFEKYKTVPDEDNDKKTITELKRIKKDLYDNVHVDRNMYAISFNKATNKEPISKNDLVNLLKIPDFESFTAKASAFEKYLSSDRTLDSDSIYEKYESVIRQYDTDVDENPITHDNIINRIPLFTYIDFMSEYDSLAKFIVKGPSNIFTNFFKVLNHISTKKS